MKNKNNSKYLECFYTCDGYKVPSLGPETPVLFDVWLAASRDTAAQLRIASDLEVPLSRSWQAGIREGATGRERAQLGESGVTRRGGRGDAAFEDGVLKAELK